MAALRTLALFSILVLMLSQVRRIETWQGMVLLFAPGLALMYWLASYEDRRQKQSAEQLLSQADLKEIRRWGNLYTGMMLGILLVFVAFLLWFVE